MSATRSAVEGAPAAEDLGPWPAVVFGLGPATLAVPLAAVDSVVASQALTRLPGAPPGVLGVLAVRGRVIAVVDPREALGIPRVDPEAADADADAGRAGRLLVTRSPEGLVALLVDVVHSAGVGVRAAVDPAAARLALIDSAAVVRRVTGTADALEVLTRPVELAPEPPSEESTPADAGPDRPGGTAAVSP